MPEVVARLATYPARARVLETNIHRLCAIFPRIVVCLNRYDRIPAYLRDYTQIEPFIPDDDLMDTGKFAPWPTAAEYVFLIDDDIVYPADYVPRMLFYADQLGIPSVIGVHGVRYRNRYAGGAGGRCIDHFESARATFNEVDVLGTGTVMLTRDMLPPFDYMAGSSGYVDVRFARYCAERELPRIRVPRPAGWLKSRTLAGPRLFATYTRSDRQAVLDEVNAIRRTGATRDGVRTPRLGWRDRLHIEASRPLGIWYLARRVASRLFSRSA